MAYPATPRTWVAGDVLTAGQLNAEVRDALLAMFPLGPPDLGWTTWAPVITQLVTVTHTATYAKYSRIGRTIFANFNLTVTGAGTTLNTITVSLPVAADTINQVVVGTGFVFDASASLMYPGAVQLASTTTLNFRPQDQLVAATTLGAGVFTAGLASPDLVRGFAIYEAAA